MSPVYKAAPVFLLQPLSAFDVLPRLVLPSHGAGGSLVSAATMASLGGVAGLLGLEVVELQRSLTSRVMTTTKGGAVGTIIK